jgi:nicotinamidase-related amidase
LRSHACFFLASFPRPEELSHFFRLARNFIRSDFLRQILAGVTTDVCVHTTMRNANDMGYECVLLEDCCAATDPANHAAAVSMVQKQGGVFGAVTTSAKLIAALEGGAPGAGSAP